MRARVSIASRTRARRLLHRLARLVPKRRYRSLPFGVTVIGHADATHSIGVVTRTVCAALQTAEIPYELISIDELSYRRGRSFVSAGTGEPSRSRHAFTLVIAWPEYVDLRVVSPRVFAGRYVIGNWLCEQTELTPAFRRGVEMVDEIWTGSSFAAEAFTKSTTNPVLVIPCVVHRPHSSGEGAIDRRARFGIPADRTVYLTIASSMVSMTRKNSIGALRAFREAFPHGQGDAVLVIKFLIDGSPDAAQIARRDTIVDDPAFGPDVVLFTEPLSDAETTDLLVACDCYVSLHRAEGFGLGVAEAMSLAKPVVATNWSGPVDHLTESNSFPVPASLISIDQHDSEYFLPGLEWAEPDAHAAAGMLRSVFEDRAHAASLGARAALDMQQRNSPEVIGRLMADRLRQLHRR